MVEDDAKGATALGPVLAWHPSLHFKCRARHEGLGALKVLTFRRRGSLIWKKNQSSTWWLAGVGRHRRISPHCIAPIRAWQSRKKPPSQLRLQEEAGLHFTRFVPCLTKPSVCGRRESRACELQNPGYAANGLHSPGGIHTLCRPAWGALCLPAASYIPNVVIAVRAI